MSKENNLNRMTQEGPSEKVTREKVVVAIGGMKPAMAAGPSDVCAKTISVSGETGGLV